MACTTGNAAIDTILQMNETNLNIVGNGTMAIISGMGAGGLAYAGTAGTVVKLGGGIRIANEAGGGAGVVTGIIVGNNVDLSRFSAAP